MLSFKINKEKCIKCGLCAQDCPVMIIDASDFPVIKEGKADQCLKCQHCLAICPTGALSILGKNPEDSVPVKGEKPGAEQLEHMIKTRRSTRKFKKDELSGELIQEMLETTAYAPTGHNDNGVLCTVVDNRKDMDAVREAIYAAIKVEFEKGNDNQYLPMLSGFQRLWDNKKIDVIMRDAPHLLLTSAPKQNVTPKEDSLIALSYFELIANANDVGTLWNGMLKWVINDIAPGLRSKIGIPEDHVFGYCMTFGKAARKYTRSVQSDGLNLNRISL